MARKFLYAIALLVVLAVAGLVAYRLYGPQLLRLGLVPSAPFVAQKPMPANEWAKREMWFARPDIADHPARWLPPGFAATKQGDAAIFFIHPTSYIDRAAWNAPLDDATANDRARVFLRGQASAFNGVGEVWAPRYRQATFGAFLTGQREAGLALDVAYRDVTAAWDAFVSSVPPSKPIIVAGHSQGALHLMRLLRQRIAGKPVARRIAAAYVVGWPVSIDTDLAAMGLPACRSADDAGCILSWQTFAEPADTSVITDTYDTSTGFDGRPRMGTAMLCTNPLTGAPNSAALATDNLGTLIPSSDLRTATLRPGFIPARCDGGRGFLLIGPSRDEFPSYILPGNNYHVFDYSLFWANIRQDAARRLAAFSVR